MSPGNPEVGRPSIVKTQYSRPMFCVAVIVKVTRPRPFLLPWATANVGEMLSEP